MPAYDRRFHPPAPVAEVTLIHPVSLASSSTLRGKLDTGADVTVIPERVVTQLRMTPKGRIWTRGYDGAYTQRTVYYVRMRVESFELTAVRCVVTDRSNVLLGRNVLNHFVVTLDGKALFFELHDSRV